jgi:hypothetical protein
VKISNTRLYEYKDKMDHHCGCFCIGYCIQTSFIIPAHASTYYFNCITRIANKNGTLTLENVENCYDKVFKGAKQAHKKNNNNNSLPP